MFPFFYLAVFGRISSVSEKNQKFKQPTKEEEKNSNHITSEGAQALSY